MKLILVPPPRLKGWHFLLLLLLFSLLLLLLRGPFPLPFPLFAAVCSCDLNNYTVMGILIDLVCRRRSVCAPFFLTTHLREKFTKYITKFLEAKLCLSTLNYFYPKIPLHSLLKTSFFFKKVAP